MRRGGANCQFYNSSIGILYLLPEGMAARDLEKFLCHSPRHTQVTSIHKENEILSAFGMETNKMCAKQGGGQSFNQEKGGKVRLLLACIRKVMGNSAVSQR